VLSRRQGVAELSDRGFQVRLPAWGKDFGLVQESSGPSQRREADRSLQLLSVLRMMDLYLHSPTRLLLVFPK
jgi:hypothetical protein